MSKWDHNVRLAAERQVVEVTGHADLVRVEVESIVQGEAFRSSRRSQEFLRHVVDSALLREFDSLKERVIGAKLYGRPIDYDTATDAIVRVVANDTRKRLTQHYTNSTAHSRVVIHLPTGSYLPTIEFTSTPPEPPHSSPVPTVVLMGVRKAWIWPVVALIALSVSLALWMQNRALTAQVKKITSDTPVPILPWSLLFEKQKSLHLVLADASVGAIQVLADQQLSLAEYVNGRYIPEVTQRQAGALVFSKFLLNHQYTTASYALTAVRVAELARTFSTPTEMTFARDLSMRTFKGGDNFVVLGTSRANPWAQLFEGELNFSTVYDPGSKEPFIANRRPLREEPERYVPRKGPTRELHESFGLVAFLPRLYQSGHVLLIAGTSSQGTEAAGDFITDLPRLRVALGQMGLRPTDSLVRLELVLRVTHAAGSPMQGELIAHRIVRRNLKDRE